MLYWDTVIITDQTIMANRPDIWCTKEEGMSA